MIIYSSNSIESFLCAWHSARIEDTEGQGWQGRETHAWKTLGWCKRRVHRSLQNPQRGRYTEASFPGTSPIFFLLACQSCPKLNLLPSLLPSLPPPMLLLPPPAYTTTPSSLSFLCQVHLYPTVYLQVATPKSDSTPFSHHIWFHQCSLSRTLFQLWLSLQLWGSDFWWGSAPMVSQTWPGEIDLGNRWECLGRRRRETYCHCSYWIERHECFIFVTYLLKTIIYSLLKNFALIYTKISW